MAEKRLCVQLKKGQKGTGYLDESPAPTASGSYFWPPNIATLLSDEIIEFNDRYSYKPPV